MGGFTLVAPTKELLERLKSHRKVERLSAYESLVLLGKQGRSVLRRALRSKKWYTRELAARGLGKTGEVSDVDSLLPLLTDRSYKVRKAAIKSIVLLLLRMDISILSQLPIKLGDLLLRPWGENGCTARDFMQEYLDPKDAEDWVILAVLYLEESEPEEAFVALVNAYEVDPAVFSEDAYYHLWEQVYYLAGVKQLAAGTEQLEIAGRALAIMLELRPDDTMVMLNYGTYLSICGCYEEAYRVYRRALLINPRDHFVAANLEGLPLTRRERRELDAEIAGNNVLFLPPNPNMGSDGVISYCGEFVQIEIPNPPFKGEPRCDDKLLETIVSNFLDQHGFGRSEFDIYGVELARTSQGAPTLFVDVVVRHDIPLE